MATDHRSSRPWYCIESLVDDYRFVADNGGDLRMLRALKILRAIIVNAGIIAVTLYALVATGADATIVATTGLLTLGLYNGVEVADYAALAQAFAEVKAEQDSEDS
ncbi:hypothetical protein BRC81_03030 [Halobacteriales archaeon QS_1_68_20]|nr:MAG: hypothetical protein BRC81_03030 [Halobacteriales archaeon QS_1_68_20]